MTIPNFTTEDLEIMEEQRFNNKLREQEAVRVRFCPACQKFNQVQIKWRKLACLSCGFAFRPFDL